MKLSKGFLFFVSPHLEALPESSLSFNIWYLGPWYHIPNGRWNRMISNWMTHHYLQITGHRRCWWEWKVWSGQSVVGLFVQLDLFISCWGLPHSHLSLWLFLNVFHLIWDGCDRQWEVGREILTSLCMVLEIKRYDFVTSLGRDNTRLLIVPFLQVCSIISSTKCASFLLGSSVSPMMYLLGEKGIVNMRYHYKCDNSNLHRMTKVTQTFFNVIHSVFIFPKSESCVTSTDLFSSSSSFLLQKHHVCLNW